MNQEELAYFQMEDCAEEADRRLEWDSLLTQPRFDYEHNKTDTYDDPNDF